MKIFIIVSIFVVAFSVSKFNFSSKEEILQDKKEILTKLQSDAIKSFSEKGLWPENLKIDERKGEIVYTFQPELENNILTIMKRYHTELSQVVIMDMKTGKIITAVAHQGHTSITNRSQDHLVFTQNQPAASLFKIITASALINSQKINSSTPFFFKGKKTTLYKKQIFSELHEGKILTNLKKAFSQSNNPAFAKIALKLLDPKDLIEHAKIYGFNEGRWNLGLFTNAHANMPESDYEYAELASGFNTSTQITSVQAALLAGLVANNGVMVPPVIIESINYGKDNINVELITNELSKKVLNQKSVKALEEMMTETVTTGTAAKSFRRVLKKYSKDYIIGGKTGSITGPNPTGKREWFVGFLRDREDNSSRYAISVLNIYSKKWYIKASHLAAEIMENLVKYDQLNKEISRNIIGE